MIYGYLRISARKKYIEFLETLVEASAKVKNGVCIRILSSETPATPLLDVLLFEIFCLVMLKRNFYFLFVSTC